ncbi:MAG: hypothetical protein JOZ32_04950 [Bryobacterales bacterium]|nr:hypothetical protein [Bryobacterales bacterium]
MSRDAEAQTAEALGRRYLERAGELLSLAFLLTGNSDATVEAVTEAVTMGDAQNPFFWRMDGCMGAQAGDCKRTRNGAFSVSVVHQTISKAASRHTAGR